MLLFFVVAWFFLFYTWRITCCCFVVVAWFFLIDTWRITCCCFVVVVVFIPEVLINFLLRLSFTPSAPPFFTSLFTPTIRLTKLLLQTCSLSYCFFIITMVSNAV